METVAPLEVRTAARRVGSPHALSDPPHTPPPPPPQEVGLKVSDVVVLIDRQQGGEAHLASKARGTCCAAQAAAALSAYRRRGSQGLKLHAALTITLMLDTLVAHNKVTCVAACALLLLTLPATHARPRVSGPRWLRPCARSSRRTRRWCPPPPPP